MIDTEAVLFQSWVEEFEQAGCTLSRTEWANAAGGAHVDLYDELSRRATGEFDAEACRARRRARQAHLLAAVDLRPGIRAVIEWCSTAGVSMAVVSSSPRTWIEAELGSRHDLSAFEVVVTPTLAIRAKPAPDLYLEAVKQLGHDPERCIVVEDALNGVLAAQNAQLTYLVIPHALTASQAFPEPTRVLTDSVELLPTLQRIHSGDQVPADVARDQPNR